MSESSQRRALKTWTSRELQRSFTKATQAGEERLEQPRAVDAHYDARKTRLVIELSNGVILMLPRRLLQGLQDATPAQISKVELTPLGTGLHWEDLDADLSVAALASGAFGSKAWMSELARHAGSSTSARKAVSSRENGKKGGRPRLHKSPT